MPEAPRLSSVELTREVNYLLRTGRELGPWTVQTVQDAFAGRGLSPDAFRKIYSMLSVAGTPSRH